MFVHKEEIFFSWSKEDHIPEARMDVGLDFTEDPSYSTFSRAWLYVANFFATGLSVG